MKYYYGLSAAEIAQTLKKTKEFVFDVINNKSLNGHFSFLNDSLLNDIEKAKSDEELQAITYPVAQALAFRIELFQIHAALDTKGKGKELYAKLVRLGCTNISAMGQPNSTTKAIDAHIRRLPNPTAQQYNNIDECHEHLYVKRYGIECSHDTYKQIKPLIEDILSPFRKKNEFTTLGYGLIAAKDGQSRYGIIFNVSREAAQTVQNTLKSHKNMLVRTSHGHALSKRQQSRPSKKRAPRLG